MGVPRPNFRTQRTGGTAVPDRSYGEVVVVVSGSDKVSVREPTR
jgi:hypothetical protein